MKSIHRIGLGAVVTVLSAGSWLACSGDDTTPGNTNGTDSGSTVDSTMETPDTGAAPDTGVVVTVDSGTTADTGGGGGNDGEAGVTLSCMTYCTAVTTTCTGAYSQYLDMNECLTACPFLPVGAVGDMMGNTVGCRLTHAGLAASLGKNPHCWHAGPFGYGGCGDECDSFCTIATSYCSADGGLTAADAGDAGDAGVSTPYATKADCVTKCGMMTKIDDIDGGGTFVDGGYNTNPEAGTGGPQAGNTLDCREWHLDNALSGGKGSAGQKLHCGHVGVPSTTCQ